jgi:hypothetical protein
MTREDVTKAVILALRAWPGSERALAQAARVPHSTLVRIRSGALRASEDVARALVPVLQRWSEECSKAADTLQRASGQTPTTERRARRRQRRED